ncbi:MAG: methylated-DNA--[protein]-cysteine S-methyltransferase [Patescibacteria group bacterium]
MKRESKKELCVISPEESKNIEITYGIHQSPFGWCLIGLTKHYVCQISFLDKEDRNLAERMIREVWPEAKVFRNDLALKPYVGRVFSGKSSKSVRLLVRGTSFQIKVWEALLSIPEGKTSNYRAIAEGIGSAKAVRAVGTACGKNPIGYLIPCHRVLTSKGGLGGYHWGIKRKKMMLTWEFERSLEH